MRSRRLTMTKIFIVTICCLMARPTSVDATDENLRLPGNPDKELNQLFIRKDGWTGGDGGTSVVLSEDKIIWLFSDTFVGQVRDGKRTNATMVNNTVAIQHVAPEDAHVDFHVEHDADGNATAVFRPESGHGFFWVHAAEMVKSRLFVFLVEIEKHDDSTFGFRETGRWLAIVDNPHDPPAEWKVSQEEIPFTQINPTRVIGFGSATLLHGDDLYVYGVDEHRIPEVGDPGRFLIVARVPQTDAHDFSEWTFYADGRWVVDFRMSTALTEEIASENSVIAIPGQRGFALVYSHLGMSRYIHVRTAPDPGGPWSRPVTVFDCPEVQWDTRNFCYGESSSRPQHGPGSRPDILHEFDGFLACRG